MGVLINYLAKDAYRIYGMRHFEAKYKIALRAEEGDKAAISVAVNPIETCISSWVRTTLGIVPFFEDLKGKEIIEKANERLMINFDIFNEIGHILSGHLESISPEEKNELAGIPLVDIYEKMLLDAIMATKEGKTNNAKPFWPDGKKFAVCLTHDVDEVRKTYQYFTRPVIHARKGEYSRALYHAGSFFTDKLSGEKPYWTFEKIMGLEEKLNVRSTFYFLQEDGEVRLHKPSTFKLSARRYNFSDPRIKQVMKELRAGGWEVGLHGSYYSYLSETKLETEKKSIESALGSKIVGTRQHHLNLKIPETWDYQAKAGIEYDASLGFKKDVGFRWGTCFPFHPMDASSGNTLSILEMPLIIMDTPLFTCKEDVWKKIEGLIDVVERQGGLLTILFHHAVFNEKEYPGWATAYEKIIRLCQEKNAWVTKAEDINTWWKGR